MTDFRAELLKSPVPLFPLPNCVLLPGAVLPLNIFEPRYRRMIGELLEHEEDERLIAIALLKDGFEPLYETNHAEIHPVVCVGRILHHERLGDGRYNILLLGCCRASVVAEDTSGEYRLASLAPLDSEGSLEEPEVAQQLARVLSRAVELKVCGGELVKMLVDAAPTLPCLVDLVAFHFIPGSESSLKQRILEDRNVCSRKNLVIRWLTGLLARAKRNLHRSFDHKNRSVN
ncbi:MAG: LON peptidase substrate-binding domain-containing protein [Planctomycetota bacterium]